MSEIVTLDEEQQKVVDYNYSQCVVAGPGAGKTRILTEKARRVMKTGKSVLCITFTKAGAAEMASRVPMLPATTIHSYCCRRVGWDDDWEYTGLLYKYLAFEEQDKYDWVLVDEVQDLNPLEMDVVLSLVGDKLFAVGDPYQSIFGFQNALGNEAIRILEDSGCKKTHVKNNYRSNKDIVERLNGVFDRSLVSMGEGKDLGLNAILFRKNQDLFETSRNLSRNKYPHTLRIGYSDITGKEIQIIGESNLILSTIHSSKGREFDRVILYDWSPDRSGEEVRCYYVCMSRASKEFVEVNNLEELVSTLKSFGYKQKEFS